jgi:CRP/FNR family transcriptional regulator
MIKDKIKNIWLFASLDEIQFEKLIELSFIERYHKDSILFHAGELSEYIYILLEGEVNIHKHDDNSNIITMGIFKNSSLLGEAASLLHIPFPSSAIFKTDGKVMKIKTSDFEKNFLNDISVAHSVIKSLLKKIQLLQQNIHLNIGLNAKDKILDFYLKNTNLKTKLKQYEIANTLSMTPETFSRNLKKLIKEEKIVKFEDGHYEVIS